VRTIGFMGAGNMGGAILRGAINVGYIQPSQVFVCEQNQERIDELAEEFSGISFADSCSELAENCDMIILAVKPYQIRDIIEEAGISLHGTAVISIAAGWTAAMLHDILKDTGATYLRAMPNTPALVGEGMTALCKETTFSKDDFAFAKGLFDAVGRTVVLNESQFDGVIAISGSSPAYVFMMIEAMADAGVREGIPRKTAYDMAAQAVLGAALMVLSSDSHPGELKDNVCSPGGTTIEAVAALESNGFRAAIMAAMDACAEKSRKMSEKQ